MLGKLLFHIISGILGLFLATKFVPGAELIGAPQNLLIPGGILGLVNFFVKPFLKTVTLPIRILTFGLFGLLINMLLVWIVADVLFPEKIEIVGLSSLFWTTVIIWVLNFFFGLYTPKRRKIIEIRD